MPRATRWFHDARNPAFQACARQQPSCSIACFSRRRHAAAETADAVAILQRSLVDKQFRPPRCPGRTALPAATPARASTLLRLPAGTEPSPGTASGSPPAQRAIAVASATHHRNYVLATSLDNMLWPGVCGCWLSNVADVCSFSSYTGRLPRAAMLMVTCNFPVLNHPSL